MYRETDRRNSKETVNTSKIFTYIKKNNKYYIFFPNLCSKNEGQKLTVTNVLVHTNFENEQCSF